MKGQKQMIEIFLYIILIVIAIYFTQTGKKINLFKDNETVEVITKETQNIVPEELITEDYVFGGDD